MATVTTTIIPTISVFPFAGYTQDSETTGAARSQVVAHVLNSAVALSGVGDNQQIVVRFDLPVNFAYAMVDYCLEITAATGGDVAFANNIDFIMTNHVTANSRTLTIPIGLNSAGAAPSESTDTEKKVYRPWCPYKGLIQAEGTSQVRVQAQSFNETANDIAYTVSCTARFLQYDVRQFNHLGVNSAVVVR